MLLPTLERNYERVGSGTQRRREVARSPRVREVAASSRGGEVGGEVLVPVGGW
jgi:hypothetical protein